MTERERILYDALSQLVAAFDHLGPSPESLEAITHAEIVLEAFSTEKVKA